METTVLGRHFRVARHSGQVLGNRGVLHVRVHDKRAQRRVDGNGEPVGHGAQRGRVVGNRGAAQSVEREERGRRAGQLQTHVRQGNDETRVTVAELGKRDGRVQVTRQAHGLAPAFFWSLGTDLSKREGGGDLNCRRTQSWRRR